jgi:hypothetical protein
MMRNAKLTLSLFLCLMVPPICSACKIIKEWSRLEGLKGVVTHHFFFLYPHRDAASYVYVGEYDRTARSDGDLFRAIEDKIVHPKYSSPDNPWDVMVMRLNSPVSKQFVRLNSDPSFPREELAELSVMGFGVDEKDYSDADYELPYILQEATVNYIDNEECNSMNGGITSDMLCAAADGRDACSGMLERVACTYGLPRTQSYSLSNPLSL